MLSHLTIRDFAIIPTLELEFQDGFTAITGETGAGKSILVDALGLLLGNRSDSAWVRQGASQADLTAEFSLDNNPSALEWLMESGLSADGQCLLRRSIASTGRSRAWINGTPVTVQQLGELGHLLVEIHGQNEHIRLTSVARQFHLLDHAGDYANDLSAVKDHFEQWRERHNEFERLEQESALSPSDLDYLKFQLDELESRSIPADEVEALEREHRKLAQGGALMEALAFSADSLDSDQNGIQTLLHEISTRLQAFAELDPGIANVSKILEEARINAQEASVQVRQALDRNDLSPERLQQVSTRLGDLADLARKHRVPMEDLQQVRDQFAERLANAENFESRRETLQQSCDEALIAYRSSTKMLSRCREKQAEILSTEVTGLMQDLGMAGGVLDIRVRSNAEARPSYNGDDEIELLVSANPGTDPGPLAKIASGGELSRISLAIKVASSQSGLSRTQVFDEVDAGIGGDTANAVGRLMQDLSGQLQALCVTHLAQVAVCADQQLQVSKTASKDQTSVETGRLGEAERVDEIARMLSGRVSDQSRQHALEMLEAALRPSPVNSG